MLFNAYVMLWTPWLLAIVFGQWVARRAALTWLGVFKAAFSGLLLLFASLYMLELLWDLHFWKKYFPNTPAVHEFGPDRSSNLLKSTLVSFRRAATAFGVVFAGIVVWRTAIIQTDAERP